MILIQVSPVFASEEFSAKKFLACESTWEKHQKISIALDKEQNADEPDLEKLKTLEYNIVRLERINKKYCSGFTAQSIDY